jgi:hypothetical protein
VRTIIAALAMCATIAGLEPARDAHAEQRVFFTDNGVYRCEQDHQVTLGKIVCRNPRQFSDYYVVYYQVDEAKGQVFTDALIPTGPGRFLVEQNSMPIWQFLLIYGRP